MAAKPKEKKTAEDFAERRMLLSITAYGIHCDFHKTIEKKIEEELNTKSVYICEYFLDKPSTRSAGDTSGGGFYPYLLRFLNEQRYVPKLDADLINEIKNASPRVLGRILKNIKNLPYTFENLWQFWSVGHRGAVITDMNRHATIGEKLLTSWKQPNHINDFRYEESSGIVSGACIYNKKALTGVLDTIATFDEISKIGAIKEQLTLGRLFSSLDDSCNLHVAGVSLSTKKIFYGYVLIYYPVCKKNKKADEGYLQNIYKEKIQEIYIPVLALYENYWGEKNLANSIKAEEEKGAGQDLSWDTFTFLNSSLEESKNPLEKALYDLWVGRKSFYQNNGLHRLTKRERLKENLVFEKYLIASPGMVGEIEKAAISRSEPKNESKGYLPSFLVVGRAGSGKDKMARIIPLFFPKYRFGRRITVNMAALKPDFLSVPLMSGGDFEWTESGLRMKTSTSTIRLKGIFEKILDQLQKDCPKESCQSHDEWTKEIGKKGMLPVVILDELNSLDIDAQGALLRLLENSTLQPLGGIYDKNVDILVIGTVNEPEDVLTLHEPLQKFLTEKIVFGGLLGKALYEYFRNMRRLREDVYFRFIRDGKIVLPNLAERRHDIPILFSFFLKDEFPKGINLKNSWIDFDIYEELMSDSLDWSGNFRELQAIAKKVAYFALVDPENQKVLKKAKAAWDEESEYDTSPENRPFRVSSKHVIAAMKEFYAASGTRTYGG